MLFHFFKSLVISLLGIKQHPTARSLIPSLCVLSGPRAACALVFGSVTVAYGCAHYLFGLGLTIGLG